MARVNAPPFERRPWRDAWAAAAGLGAALLPELFIEEELRTSELVIASSTAIETTDAYFLAILENRPTPPVVTGYCDGLLNEAHQTGGEGAPCIKNLDVVT